MVCSRRKFATVIFLVFAWCQPIAAHEYWIDPIEYVLSAGDELVADVRNGENFAGVSFPYDPQRYKRFYLVGDNQRFPVKSRLGDTPALKVALKKPGLYSVILQSTQRALQYDTLEKFRDFLTYHNLQQVEEVHRQRGLPDSNIQERYYRFAKSLVQVGEADDELHVALQPQKLLFELVPLNNPYAKGNNLRLQLLFQQRALADAQVEVFHNVGGGGQVTRKVANTNSLGEVTVDISEAGEYLINAVQLIQPRQAGAHWESLWASITFEKQ